jgi:hypothetical protein
MAQAQLIEDPARAKRTEPVNAEEDTDLSLMYGKNDVYVDEHSDTNLSENEENPAILDIDYPSENENASDIPHAGEEEPDSTSTVPNFTKLLEDHITAYRREKYLSEKTKIGSVTLSNKEVKKFLKRAKVKCIALYSKKVMGQPKRLQAHTHSVRNTAESNSKHNLHNSDNKLKSEQKVRRGGRSRVSVLVGGESVKGDTRYNQEEEHDTSCEHTSRKGVTADTHKDEETDASTDYDAVGQFDISIEGSYKIKYSWTSNEPIKASFLGHVAVEDLPDVQEDEIESQDRQLHFTSFVQCTMTDGGKIN